LQINSTNSQAENLKRNDEDVKSAASDYEREEWLRDRYKRVKHSHMHAL